MKGKSRPAKECTQLLSRIVSWACLQYGVEKWKTIFSKTRGDRNTSDCRTMVIAVALAAGIPTATVARAMKRTWQAVDAARMTQMKRVETDAWYREAFMTILIKSMNPELTPPAFPPQ